MTGSDHNPQHNLPIQARTKEARPCPQISRTCPVCHRGILEYNGLLNLVCPHCGREWSGSFT